MDAETYADMLPWLIFLVVDRQSGLDVAWASGWAAVAALGLGTWSYWRGRRSPVIDTAIGLFTLCFAVALGLPTWDHMVTVPRATTVVALAAVALVSLAVTPITEVYTAPMVAPGTRSDPRFRKVNVEMTLGWGVGALFVALVCCVGGLVRGSIVLTLCEWVLPLGLAVATSLWAMRRWELFRLSTDDTVAPTGPAAAHGAVVAIDGAAARDAVIRRLPLRREETL